MIALFHCEVSELGGEFPVPNFGYSQELRDCSKRMCLMPLSRYTMVLTRYNLVKTRYTPVLPDLGSVVHYVATHVKVRTSF